MTNSTKQEKVFCICCKHFEYNILSYKIEDCIHPNNLTDNWCKPGGDRKEKPAWLNKNNNCGWYEEEEKRVAYPHEHFES